MSRATSVVAECRDGRRVEARERPPIALALAQDRRPREPRLRALEDEQLEQVALVPDGDAPLLVVVGAVGPRRGQSTRPQGGASGPGGPSRPLPWRIPQSSSSWPLTARSVTTAHPRPMTEERDPYAVLGVPSTRPGRGRGGIPVAGAAPPSRTSPATSDAERRMAEINTAWSTLRDPDAREAWDRANGVEPRMRRAGRRPNGRARPRPAAARRTSRQGRAPGQRQAGGAAPRARARGSAARQPARVGAAVRAPHRVVARRDRAGRPGLPPWLQPRREGGRYREEIDRYLAAIARPGRTGAGARAQARAVFRWPASGALEVATNAAIRSSASATA